MPTWIFDLDNTLHDAEAYIFPEMNRQMTAYLSEHIGISHAEADAIRQAYWQRYGTTLAGLRQHHRHIKPAHFLHHTHQLPALAHELRPMRALKATLSKLSGKKVLFTNGPKDYAQTLLKALGIRHLFTGLVAVEHTAWRAKPKQSGYHYLLNRYGLNPRHCIMVEDSRPNLLTAKRLGMKTVWISKHSARGPAVDILIRHLDELPRRISRQVAGTR